MDSYKLRHLEQEILHVAKRYKVVLLTGARQAGKTMLLKHLFPTIPLITFDLHTDPLQVKEDPDLFIQSHPTPIILDEVQYVPNILSAIKRQVDRSFEKGQYFLTASHNHSLLNVVTESMAGRVGIVDVSPMTIFEQADAFAFNDGQQSPPSWLEVYLKTPESLMQRFAGTVDKYSVYETVWRGGYPELIDQDVRDYAHYFENYLRTYIERDVVYAREVGSIYDFEKFFKIMASLTGQEVNHSELGCELGLARGTARQWLGILRQTYQWREVPPFFSNQIKRIAKKGKGYSADTGFACQLQYISSPEALAVHPFMGTMFETYCVNQVFALKQALAFPPAIYHWRTIAGAEVDMVLMMNNTLYPIEVKMSTQINKYDAHGINALRKTYEGQHKIAEGIILYPGKTCYKLTENVTVLPYNALMTPKL